MMWGGRGAETASGEYTDLIMIHDELLQETCDRGQLNYLPTLHFTDSTVAQSQLGRKLSLSTLLIYFTNCQSHLMGEILKSLIFTLTEPRPTGCLSPNVLTHSKLPASLFVSLWHLKTPRRLGVVSPLQYWTLWCVRNMNNVEEMESSI